MASFVWVITILIPKLYTLHIIFHSIKLYDQVVSKVQHYEIILARNLNVVSFSDCVRLTQVIFIILV